MSYSWAFSIDKDMERIRALSRGRVVKPAKAFEYWLLHHRPPLYRDYHVPDTAAFLENIKFDHAVTTYGGDQVMLQYLFPRRFDVYIRADDAGAWHKKIVAEGFVGMGNLRLLLDDPDIIDTASRRRGRSVVCVPQLILDLLVEGGACSEAAKLLMEVTYRAGSALQRA